MGAILAIVFAVIVIAVIFGVWAMNGAESRKNARAAASQLRENRTVHNGPPPDRGTGID
jgi:hypothetical protein